MRALPEHETRLKQALSTLQSPLLAVVDLRFLHDASYQSIAEQLGITQVNVRKRAELARRHLVLALQRQGIDPSAEP
ncbi:MAG: sigma-70 family RNA polymerase sigma factor [Paludibacterium sp.]|uniref:sigma factor-like helix-turn-helix DNA-binding protein n=1 Tax=Paludibacterium sp. TaxID=1917523 RepID=UPI0025D75B2A|nr:sigma factor-like helix-turn-helix DNA-binding protein [Paludibacterium sp.]MBV8047892.1 sigma-70 family RNA polymerase sigma factor [Paludibacterium sp.]